MNRRCPVCQHPFASGDEVIEVETSEWRVVISRDAKVRRGIGTRIVRYCVEHAP